MHTQRDRRARTHRQMHRQRHAVEHVEVERGRMGKEVRASSKELGVCRRVTPPISKTRGGGGTAAAEEAAYYRARAVHRSERHRAHREGRSHGQHVAVLVFGVYGHICDVSGRGAAGAGSSWRSARM
eukprot:2314805-Rhodomonas_salina.1